MSSVSDIAPTNASIAFRDVTLRFRAYAGKGPSLKQAIMDKARGRHWGGVSETALFKGLNLSINHGERLGIIGRNGAGKSTLLKMIAGIYAPTAGSVQVTGRIAPLIQIGSGMIHDLTGAENIVLNGVLMGFSRREMVDKVDHILDFADLSAHRDMPLKYYSSGMMMRLAFATATDVNPEILLIDEVFSAGDAEFIAKARDRMHSLVDASHIVITVSHSLELIKDLSQRVIWIDQGSVVADGDPDEVTAAYLAEVAAKA